VPALWYRPATCGVPCGQMQGAVCCADCVRFFRGCRHVSWFCAWRCNRVRVVEPWAVKQAELKVVKGLKVGFDLSILVWYEIYQGF
jgi:hypothetical protein